MLRFGVGTIVVLYVLYTVGYFFGLDGANDYFWVNNDFFLAEMIGASALITGVMVTHAVRQRRQLPPEGRHWRPFRPVLYAAALTIFFVPFAIVLAFISFVTGTSGF